VLNRLRRIRRSANSARDCDVLIERLKKTIRRHQENLPSRPTGHATKRRERKVKRRDRQWLELLNGERGLAQQAIVTLYHKSMQNDGLPRLFQKFVSKIKQRSSQDDQNFARWSQRQLKTQTEVFFQAVPDDFTDLEKLHQFRIQSKAFRYAIEILGITLDRSLIESVYQKVAKLQEKLGRINDLAVSCQQLKTQQKQSQKRSDNQAFGLSRKKTKRKLKQSIRAFQGSVRKIYLEPIRKEMAQLLTSNQLEDVSARGNQTLSR
jgi:CHAD domain-containing protein